MRTRPTVAWDHPAIPPKRRIYVADSQNHRIVRLDDMTGTGWLTLGTQGSGDKQFNEPWGPHVDHKGRIYVADYGNNRGHGDVHLRPPIDIVALAVSLARCLPPTAAVKGIRPGCLQ